MVKQRGITLSTVNVVEFADGDVIGLVAYPETKEGNAAAEERFKAVCSENRPDKPWTPAEIQAMVADGVAEYGGWKAIICHSTSEQ